MLREILIQKFGGYKMTGFLYSKFDKYCAYNAYERKPLACEHCTRTGS